MSCFHEQVYMVNELNAHPAVQNSIWIATTIPWSFKVSGFAPQIQLLWWTSDQLVTGLQILYGFISDTCPIGGERR